MRRFAAVLLALGLAACGDDEVDVAAFCARAGSLEDLEDVFEGEGVPEAEAFERAAAEIEALAEDAPDEVADDLDIIAGALEEVAGVVAEVDLSDPSTLTDPANPAALQELADDLEALGEDVEGAQGRVDAFLEDRCGISVDDE